MPKPPPPHSGFSLSPSFSLSACCLLLFFILWQSSSPLLILSVSLPHLLFTQASLSCLPYGLVAHAQPHASTPPVPHFTTILFSGLGKKSHTKLQLCSWKRQGEIKTAALFKNLVCCLAAYIGSCYLRQLLTSDWSGKLYMPCVTKTLHNTLNSYSFP